MTDMMQDVLEVNSTIQHRREQRESVKGKETPYRVEFRYWRGHRSWQYFETLEAAIQAFDGSVSYGMTGRAVIELPSSQQIQKKGPRGGWGRLDG